MKKGNYIIGIVFILVGIIILLSNLNILNIDYVEYWPYLLIIPGLLFEIGYFINRKEPGLLIPGGILTTYGIIFMINIYYGWHWMAKLWPLFPLGVAIGLFQFYIFGERDNALLIPVGIIGGFSIMALSFTLDFLNFALIQGTVLILLGLFIIFKRR